MCAVNKQLEETKKYDLWRHYLMNNTAKLETKHKLKGINRDVVIVTLSHNVNEEFTLKSVERLKHVYFNIFTDHDRRLFDNQAPTRVVAAVKYP